jgi:hypothetical protein
LVQDSQKVLRRIDHTPQIIVFSMLIRPKSQQPERSHTVEYPWRSHAGDWTAGEARNSAQG